MDKPEVDAKKKLKAAAGAAPWTVLYCPTCVEQTLPETSEPHGRYEWAVSMHCGKCSTNWNICTICSKQRVHLITPPQLSRHQRERHRQPGEQVEKKNPPKEEIAPRLSPSKMQTIPATYFPRAASQNFFTNEKKNPGSGPRHLVSMAVLHNSEMAKDLLPGDIKMFMTLAYFVNTISRPQRENLSSVLFEVVHALERRTKPIRSKSLHVPIPATKEEIRKTICEGKFCLRENLPHPQVYSDIPKHAYLLPSQCIADCLAHGLLDNREDKHPYQTLPKSPMAMRISTANKALGARSIFLTLWSDDFEPNNLKDNRGSVWLQTLSIQTESSGTLTTHHVYPIIVGPKGSDHNDAMETIWNDLKKISEPVEMYNGATGNNEKVSCHVLCYIMDQPECRSINGVLGGGSNSFARFGYVGDICQVASRMRPCDDCWRKLMEVKGDEHYEISSCPQCLNWMATPPESITYETPKDFPESECPLRSKMTTFRQLTYLDLKEFLRTCHEKIVEGTWTTNVASAYLTANGINGILAASALKCATNEYALKKAVDEDNTHSTEETQKMVQTLEAQKKDTPSEFQIAKFPAMWNSGLTLNQCPQATMHILFLGIVKKSVLWLQDWSTCQKKYTALQIELEKRTRMIRQLGLSWMKMEPYKGKKLGGWVSENYLAFCRVLPWIYLNLPNLDLDPPYVEPEREKTKWNKKETTAWLKSRNLDTEGNAQALKERVLANADLPEADPYGNDAGEVLQWIKSMWVLVGYLMGMPKADHTTVNVTERLLRIFLTHTYDFVEEMKLREDSKPSWLTSYNFVCLLNLPQQIEMLGPVRNRYEGGCRGEGYLRSVKGHVRGTSRPNWPKNLLTTLLQQRTISLIGMDAPEEESHTIVDDDSSDTSSLSAGGERRLDLCAFKTYKSKAEVLALLSQAQEALSVILVLDEADEPGVLICYYQQKVRMACRLAIDGEGRQEGGLHYFSYVVDSSDDYEAMELIGHMYGVLLPLPGKPVYTMVTDDWLVLDSNRKLVLHSRI